MALAVKLRRSAKSREHCPKFFYAHIAFQVVAPSARMNHVSFFWSRPLVCNPLKISALRSRHQMIARHKIVHGCTAISRHWYAAVITTPPRFVSQR